MITTNSISFLIHSNPSHSSQLTVSFPCYCTCTFKLKGEYAEVSICLPLSCTTSQASFDEEEVRKKVEGSCNFATLPDASQKPLSTMSTMSIPLRVRPTREYYGYASHPFNTQSIIFLLHLLLLQDPNRYDTPSHARIKVPSTYSIYTDLLGLLLKASFLFFLPIAQISIFCKQAIQQVPDPHLSSFKTHQFSRVSTEYPPHHIYSVQCTSKLRP